MTTHTIKHRFTGATLFECDVPDEVASGLRTRHALEQATKARADLSGAYLSGADLSGADRVTDEQAIANLDKVREIILDNAARLDMGHWHADESNWRDHTCAEELLCDTTHCMAGWLQVCSTDPKIRALEPWFAGVMQAPVAAKMFYRHNDEALSWLRDRKYVADIEESNKRAEERKARKAAEVGGAS